MKSKICTLKIEKVYKIEKKVVKVKNTKWNDYKTYKMIKWGDTCIKRKKMI